MNNLAVKIGKTEDAIGDPNITKEICLLEAFETLDAIQVTTEGNIKQIWNAIKLVVVNKMITL